MTNQDKGKAKPKAKTATKQTGSPAGKSVYATKNKKGRKPFKKNKRDNEFAQEIVDLARVTRVMAGGKRMRFRACVAIGNRKGKVAVGLAKGADVTIAINKAVNVAKKNFTEVPMVNSTIPHEVYEKYGAAKVLLKPAAKGKGVVAGGAVRLILELAGISNITTKNLGTNNKVSVAKCTIIALSNLQKVKGKKPKTEVVKKLVAKKSVVKKVVKKTGVKSAIAKKIEPKAKTMAKKKVTTKK